MSQTPLVAAVVLAAGTSSRLGQPKQLAPIAGRPALAYTLDALRASRVARIVLVLGHAADDIAAALDLTDVTVVRNDKYAEGQSTSVLAGVKSLGDEIAAALMVVGDQPLLSPSVVDAIVGAFERTSGPFIVPVYENEWGNPVLLARVTWPLLDNMKGDTGARPILRKHMDMVLEVPVPGALLDDIDTPDDYARIRGRMEGAR
ncbi:MAG: nucleotidyltransferase family protein [Chloroflexota bacterium]|nr:nucleotidyltransferase family protein [Chloroflexota bacterium]MDQ6906497.1 nucleotidyltransferase family protein [Chloroflexota bacterium]